MSHFTVKMAEMSKLHRMAAGCAQQAKRAKQVKAGQRPVFGTASTFAGQKPFFRDDIIAAILYFFSVPLSWLQFASTFFKIARKAESCL